METVEPAVGSGEDSVAAQYRTTTYTATIETNNTDKKTNLWKIKQYLAYLS